MGRKRKTRQNGNKTRRSDKKKGVMLQDTDEAGQAAGIRRVRRRE